jgi:hypothetical protein
VGGCQLFRDRKAGLAVLTTLKCTPCRVVIVYHPCLGGRAGCNSKPALAPPQWQAAPQPAFTRQTQGHGVGMSKPRACQRATGVPTQPLLTGRVGPRGPVPPPAPAPAPRLVPAWRAVCPARPGLPCTRPPAEPPAVVAQHGVATRGAQAGSPTGWCWPCQHNWCTL